MAKTYTKEVTHVPNATLIVNDILGELAQRRGFKDVFPHIPKDVLKELTVTLSSIVEEHING